MVGALWYDYKVARPAVDSAYARIGKLNEEVNSNSGRTYMTEKDVQAELARAPSETFTEDRYFVEVYSWRAGLPIKTHNYYAVYTKGPPHIFLMHYPNELDRSELRPRQSVVAAGAAVGDPLGMDVAPAQTDEPRSTEKKNRRPRGDRPEGGAAEESKSTNPEGVQREDLEKPAKEDTAQEDAGKEKAQPGSTDSRKTE